MSKVSVLFALAGLAAALVLLASLDYRAVLADMAALGAVGFGLLLIVRASSIFLCGWAWFSLEPKGAVSLKGSVVARIVRDGVANLLAAVPAIGEVVGVRMLMLAGNRAALATAVTVGDLTMEMLSQAVFTMMGAAALIAVWPGETGNQLAVAATAASLLLVAGLALVQHPRIVAWLESLAGRFAGDLLPPDGREGLSEALRALYGRRRGLVAGFAIHLAAWFVGCLESGVILGLLGHPLDVLQLLALQAAVYALRSAAFMVPAGAGVQEGGFCFVGVALGLDAETAMAVSLITRLVEIAVSLPGLALWHRIERQGRSGN